MSTATGSQRGRETRSSLPQRHIEPGGQKPRQGVCLTPHRVLVWIRRLFGKGVASTGDGPVDVKKGVASYSNRPADIEPELERIVRFVGTEPLHMILPGLGTKLEVKPPVELHVLRPRQNVKVSWWGKLTDWIIVGAIILFGIWAWQRYLVPHEYYPPRPDNLPSIQKSAFLVLAYPKYVASGDQGYIDVTLCNETDKKISSTVVVDFYDDHHIVCMNCSGTNRVEFKDLAPHVRQTWRVSFVLNEAPSFYLQDPPPVYFDVKVVDRYGNSIGVVANQAIRLAPIPYLRTIMRTGGALSVVYVALLNLPVDMFKKRLASG